MLSKTQAIRMKLVPVKKVEYVAGNLEADYLGYFLRKR